MKWFVTFPGACGIAENVNWWGEAETFNGSTGIGAGSSAPTGACTPGVAYWQSATPTVTTNPLELQAGTLHKCTAANEWTPYYRPFTYPHPLACPSP
jgi:hypothetical protein